MSEVKFKLQFYLEVLDSYFDSTEFSAMDLHLLANDDDDEDSLNDHNNLGYLTANIALNNLSKEYISKLESSDFTLVNKPSTDKSFVNDNFMKFISTSKKLIVDKASGGFKDIFNDRFKNYLYTIAIFLPIVDDTINVVYKQHYDSNPASESSLTNFLYSATIGKNCIAFSYTVSLDSGRNPQYFRNWADDEIKLYNSCCNNDIEF